MRSKIISALAFTGLLMIAVPFTASAHDTATCNHRPSWGYTHPNWYNGWWQKNCSWRGGYNQNYYGSGWTPLLPFSGYYGQQYNQPYYNRPNYGYGQRYTYNDHDADDGYGWHGHRHWDRDDGWRDYDHWKHWDHDRDHDRGWHNGWHHDRH